MNRAQKTTGIAAALFAATTAAPAVHSLAATHSSATATAKKFTGPYVDNRWGGVQVSITVKHKKITAVKALVEPHTSRSQFIDDQAIPMLKDEVLQAQNANIDMISGATDTSTAYQESLQGAVARAEKKKLLK